MKIFVNKDIKRFFLSVSIILIVSFLLSEGWMLAEDHKFSLGLCIVFFLSFFAMGVAFIGYFKRQNELMEQAVSQIDAYLAGDVTARIECDSEGELYRLLHSVNSMAGVLSAHATKELQEKEFLKNTISDISHQLKTPLAALNIYNGLLQEEAETLPEIKEFTTLSEQELDRIETLVQSLLKITKLDAGSIQLEKTMESVADMMQEIQQHFAYRAKEEQKQMVLCGVQDVSLCCDRHWMMEAIDNIVKNALDHTEAGNTISIEWKASSFSIQIMVKDDGCGIHPEDLHHIFKRFYRSRFSKDKQGLGLGLPLAKAIVESHNGTILVDSKLGRGTSFTMNFLNPTKL